MDKERGGDEGRGSAVTGFVLAAVSVGPGCLLALVLCLARHADSALGILGMPVMKALMAGLLATVALAAALRALVGPVARCAFVRNPRAAAPIAGVLCILGIGLLALCSLRADADLAASDSFPSGLVPAAAAGVALGGGVSLFALWWVRVLAGFEPVALVRCGAAALLVAGLCYACFCLLWQPLHACSLLAAVSCGAAAPTCLSAVRAFGLRDPSAEPGLDLDSDRRRELLCAMSDGGSQVASRAAGGVRLRDLYRMLWIPLVGVLFCAFIAGLTWDPVASFEEGRRVHANGAVSVLAGSAAVVLAVALAARGRSATQVLALLGRALLPVGLAVVLVVPVLQQWTETSASVAGTLLEAASTGGFALMTLVALVELACAARLAGVAPDRALAGLLLAVAAAVAAGLVAIGALGTAGRTVCLVLEAAFLTTVAVSFALRPHGTATEPAAGGGGATGGEGGVAGSGVRDGGGLPESPEARCSRLAGQAGLSPREAEVLAYLGRGHGSTFIARELGISENTVRTHVRHIYEKLGVSSREGLLALVNEWAAGGVGTAPSASVPDGAKPPACR